jgi:isopenicillin N synthase-like dioxygenase
MSEIVANGESIIPIIDFSGYLNGSNEEKVKTATALGKACEEIGFVVLKGHGIDIDIINEAYAATWECKLSPSD